MIDSRKLKVFLTVAHCNGSYTGAARLLNTVQSTISHAMRDLEEDLECVLFRKVGKRMVLTDSALSFLEYAKQIEHLMNEARESVNDSKKWGRRRFTIGASISVSVCFIPEVLRELNECFPACTTTVLTGNAPENMAAVREGKVDIAFNMEPDHEPQLVFRPIFADELAWIISPTHPFQGKPDIEDESFRNQRFVIFDQGSYTCRLVENYFRRKKFAPKSLTFMGSMEAIKAFIKLGQGVGLMPAWVAKEELDAGLLKVFPAGDPTLQRRWGVVHRKTIDLGDMEETFLQLCIASIQNKSLQGYHITPLGSPVIEHYSLAVS